MSRPIPLHHHGAGSAYLLLGLQRFEATPEIAVAGEQTPPAATHFGREPFSNSDLKLAELAGGNTDLASRPNRRSLVNIKLSA